MLKVYYAKFFIFSSIQSNPKIPLILQKINIFYIYIHKFTEKILTCDCVNTWLCNA